MINAVDHTITLPVKKSNKLIVQHENCMYKQLLGQKCIQKLLGLLHSVVVAVPGGFALFTSLQQVLRQLHRIRMTEKLLFELVI